MSESHGPFRLDKAGVYDLIDEQYHSDPCPQPSLSASIAKIVVGQSPLHAKLRHPRLVDQPEQKHSDAMDMGSVLHALIFQPDRFDSLIEVVAEDSWRTKVAKTARDTARSEGRTPILAGKFAEFQEIAKGVTGAKKTPFPSDGMAERTFVWKWGAVWCRAKIDWISADRRRIRDLKTTAQLPGDPDNLRGRVFDLGWPIQAAMYRRAVRECLGVEADMEFVALETKPPFDFHIVRMGADVDFLGEKQLMMAVDQWEAGVVHGKWPGYSHRPFTVTLPPWIEARWLDKEEEE